MRRTVARLVVDIRSGHRSRLCAGLGVGLFVVALATAAPLVAHAQRGARANQADLAKLASELDELREKTVQIPTLAAAVEALSARLVTLERQLAERRREQKSIPDAIARLDTVDEQVHKLASAVRGLQTRVAGLEQPWSPDASAGGVAHDSGFSWTTGDGTYKLALGGYFQFRHQTRVREGAVEEATFRLRRARLGVSGHLGSQRFRYKILLSALNDAAALDYYFEHDITGSIGVRVGQYKTPFLRDFLISSTRLAFVDRPQLIERFRYDRDLQVGVQGRLAGDRFAYYLGVGNGAGPNRLNDNLDVDAVLRIDAVLAGERFKYAYGDLGRSEHPTLMVGAGVVHDLVSFPAAIGGIALETDVDDDGDVDNVHVVSASVDAIVRYAGFELAAEGVLRYESYGTILDHPDNAELAAAVGRDSSRLSLGGIGQATMTLPRSLPLDLLAGVRAGYSRLPFLGVGGRSSAIPAGEHLFEAGGLLQLYSPSGSRRLGLTYDYRNFDGDAVDEHRVVLEAQLVL